MRKELSGGAKAVLVFTLFANACAPTGPKQVDTAPPPSDPEKTLTVPPPPTSENLQLANPITVDQVARFYGRCVNCDTLGILPENIKGAQYNNDVIFYASGTDGSDYMWRMKADGQVEQLDWSPTTEDGTNVVYNRLNPGETIEDVDFTMQWNPNVRDSNGNIVISVNNDGVLDYYALPEELPAAFDENDIHPVQILIPNPQPTADATPTEAPAKELDPQDFPVQGMACINQADCFNGQIKINEDEGKRFYHDFWYKVLTNSQLQRTTIEDKGVRFTNTPVNYEVNQVFVDYFKNSLGYDITQVKDEASFNDFMTFMAGRNYEMPEGMPMIYYSNYADGMMEIRPAPAFNLKTLVVKDWTAETYLQKDLKGEIKKGDVFGMGPQRHRWGITFTQINGVNYAGLVITGGDTNEEIYGNNPLTPNDISIQNGDLDVFQIIVGNIHNARLIPRYENRFIGVAAIGSSDSMIAENIQGSWKDLSKGQYSVIEAAK